MPPHLSHRDPPPDLALQTRPQQPLDLAAQPRLAPRDPPRLRRARVGERAFARDEDGEEDAEGPDFGRGGLVGVSAEDFGRGEGGRAVETCEGG